jgi:PIN domain nuclease of toxin-antitoxin system
MKYLLDTHTLIWTLLETTKLSQNATNAIFDDSNTIYVSSIAFWEICVKIGCGKLGLGDIEPENLPQICYDCGFELLMLTGNDASSFHQLSGAHHKDPFDRILVWQSIRNDLTLITDDKNIGKYTSDGLQVVW